MSNKETETAEKTTEKTPEQTNPTEKTTEKDTQKKDSKKDGELKAIERMENAYKSGGLTLNDPELVKKQRTAAWDMIKKFGKNLLASKEEKNVVNVSMPVYVFEPRSYLQRLCDHWCYLPEMYKKAADPVERLRWVVTELVAGLHNTCQQFKPFNPILGETYEATLEDGSQIFCEQSSHHPPVSNLEVLGPNNSFHIYGYGEWIASFGGNTVKGHHLGPMCVKFKDGTNITFSRPRMELSGLIFGDRVIEYIGTIKFRDLKNKLAMNLIIGPPAPSGLFGFFGHGKPPSDYLVGDIVQATGENGEPKKDDKVLSTISGSWVGRVEFDGKIYWDFRNKDKKYDPIPVEDPLPSDCRLRADLICLAKDEIDNSQRWKDTLEIKQRREKDLRKATEKKKEQDKKDEKKKK